jgi:hypothetical protein
VQALRKESGAFVAPFGIFSKGAPMKRILPLAVALTFTAFVTACGENNNASRPAGTGGTASSPTTPSTPGSPDQSKKSSPSSPSGSGGTGGASGAKP